MRRLREVKARFPSLLVDLAFLESLEDLQTCRGGLGSAGYRRSDVTTIIRARNCSNRDASAACETLYVDDYRYETSFLLSDVVEWHRLVVALRVIGQSYFWIRGIGLMLSCYFVFGIAKSETQELTWTRLNNACCLFMKVPKQCVVYGSPFPVVCYALAHLLDASFMYEVFKSRYSTQAGILQVNLRSFVSYAVVQMRNVWVYALIWQIVVTMTTSRWLSRSNRLHNGIIGVPAFCLSAMSSTTLFAQYRSTSFRSTKILHTMILPSNVGRGWVASNYQYSSAHRGQGSTLLGGVAIDVKFLLCCVLVLVVAWIFRLVWFRIKRKELRGSCWYFLAPTPVPYSAGVLWPTASMCVRWMSSFFCIQDEHRRLPRQQQKEVESEHLSRRFRLLRWSRFDGVVVQFAPHLPSHQLWVERLQTDYKSIFRSSQQSRNTYRLLQHRMQCVHIRSDDVEANVALMNAVVMSDPLVYFRMTLGESHSTILLIIDQYGLRIELHYCG